MQALRADHDEKRVTRCGRRVFSRPPLEFPWRLALEIRQNDQIVQGDVDRAGIEGFPRLRA